MANPMDCVEDALRARFEEQSALIDSKQHRLSRLIDTFNIALDKLKRDKSESMAKIHQQKEAQIKTISEKYDKLEKELIESTDKIVGELTEFIEKSMKDRREQVRHANDVLLQALNSEGSLVDDAEIMSTSIQRILKSQLPDLTLSQLLELKTTNTEHRQIELRLVESLETPIPQYENLTSNDLDCRGDFHESELEQSDASYLSDTVAIAEHDGDVSISGHNTTPHPTSSHSTNDLQCPMVSFSKSIAQAQIPGFSSHIAHAGTNAFVVDSFAPAIFKIDKDSKVKCLISVENKYAVVGLAASADYLYVQCMDVTDYNRTVFVYTTEDGKLVKKWVTPNLLGSSIALVYGHLVISSRDKVMVCSPTGKHIKDIPVTPSCVKTLCALSPDSVILCSTSASLVMKLNVESGVIAWRSHAVKSPVCTAADTFGRVYVLVQPSIIYVMDANSGELLMQSTLSCPGGMMEGLCLTENGLLLTAISYRSNKNSKPCCHSVLNTFRLEGVC